MAGHVCPHNARVHDEHVHVSGLWLALLLLGGRSGHLGLSEDAPRSVLELHGEVHVAQLGLQGHSRVKIGVCVCVCVKGASTW